MVGLHSGDHSEICTVTFYTGVVYSTFMLHMYVPSSIQSLAVWKRFFVRMLGEPGNEAIPSYTRRKQSVQRK